MRRTRFQATLQFSTIVVAILLITSLSVHGGNAQEPARVTSACKQPAGGSADAYANSLRLAIESRKALRFHPRRSLLLAIEAVETARRAGHRVPPQVKEALIESLSATGSRVLTTPPLPAAPPADEFDEDVPPAPRAPTTKAVNPEARRDQTP